MKNIFKAGDEKTYIKVVTESDTVNFPVEGQLHNVYSTYSLARDAEWACRLFVLDMREKDEEGIGTMLTLAHHSPAAVGSTVVFTAQIKSVVNNEIICTYHARVGNRLVATGETGQKILNKEKLKQKFYKLN